MKKMILLMLVCCFLLPNVVVAEMPPVPEIPPFPDIQSDGNTYHVDKDIGNNSDNGTAWKPWKTIQHGVDTITAGDTLIVHPSLSPYKHVNITNGGTENDWISIKGEEGEDINIEDWGGFYIADNASYIYLDNFKVTVTVPHTGAGIKIRKGSKYIVAENMDLNGNYSGHHGFVVNDDEDDEEGVQNCYFNNMEVYNFKCTGVQTANPVKDIVFKKIKSIGNGHYCYDAGSVDGFAGRSNPEEPDNASDPDSYHNSNIFYINCESHDNGGDGFDNGAKDGVSGYKNCTS